MICTRSRRKLFITCIGSALMPAMSWSQAGAAPIVIPTNSNGADAEVRESETNVGFDGVPVGANRGGSVELASRIRDQVEPLAATDPSQVTNWFPANDRSSVMYLKFDISSLPGSSDPLWNDHNVHLRLSATQNGNFNNLFGPNPSNPAENVLLRYRVLGLEPGNVYADDNPAAANRTDRVGTTNYTNPEYKYNWSESAITFYNAPGITPHCMLQGACLDTNIPNSDANSVVQTLGLYDDFNSDVRELGTFVPPNPLAAGSDLQVGQAIDFNDPDGNLKQLVFDAQDAGRSFVTLMVHLGIDGTVHQPNVGRPGTAPNGMLARNYLVNPKERTTLLIDPDSPYSGASNSAGEFSPQLLIRIPEPSSVMLMGLASLAAAGFMRRRN